MKKIFTKLAFLAIVLLIVEVNSAWAAEVTETYDFAAFVSGTQPNVSLSSTAVEQSGTNAKTVYVMNDYTGLTLNGRFALDSSNSTGNTMRWMWRSSSNAYQNGLAGNWNNKGTSVTSFNISILNLKKDDKVTITFAVQSGKAAQPFTCSANIISATKGGAGIAESTALSSNTAYYMLNDGNLDLYVTNNNMAIQKIVIVTTSNEAITDKPVISVTGANEGYRTVSITGPKTNTGSSTVTYYTKDGSTPSSTSTLYNGNITITPSDATDGKVTIKAISYKDGDVTIASPIAEYTLTGIGTTLSLNAPTASVTLNNGVPTYSFVSNNSSVIGTPAATLTAKLNDEVVSLTDNSLTPSTKGTLVVTASATGYADASTTIPVSDLFAPVWSSTDYSTLTVDNAQSVLGDNWNMSTGGRWASWNAGNEPYTYFGDGSSNNINVEENLRMRGVISLVLGYGLGRNVTGGEAITMNNMQEGYIAAYKMYNGFGSHAAAESNYTSYVIATGTSTSVNTNNGSLLIQAVMYAPVPEKVNVAVNESGTASLVTPCALDFTGSTLKAYVATAVTETSITLEEVTTVAAGQPIVVKGESCDVNVIAEAAAPAVNLFQTGAMTVAEGQNVYALGKADGQFHKVAEGVAIPAGKAYIIATTAAKTLALNFGGEATGISNATVVKQNGAAFNLMGQKVNADAKGIVIINGKKFNNK